MNHLNKKSTRFKSAGFSTSLMPSCFLNTENHVSKNIEGFLTALKKTSSSRLAKADASNAWIRKPEKSTKSFRDWKIRMNLCSNRQHQLHQSNLSRRLQAVVLQPLYKCGRPWSLPKGDYPVWGSKNIPRESEDVFVSSREKIVTSSFSTRAIPFPNILIKDNNIFNKKGVFPTRLIITANELYRDFLQDWLSWDKDNARQRKVNYSHVSTVKSSNLKEIPGEIELKRDEVTIVSVDVINMYPSIKLSTIKKAVIFFSRKVTVLTKKTINICLELIRVGIRSTLISFGGEWYKYHSVKTEEQGLAIGGYESDILTNLFASYVLRYTSLFLTRQPTTASIEITAY